MFFIQRNQRTMVTKDLFALASDIAIHQNQQKH